MLRHKLASLSQIMLRQSSFMAYAQLDVCYDILLVVILEFCRDIMMLCCDSLLDWPIFLLFLLKFYFFNTKHAKQKVGEYSIIQH